MSSIFEAKVVILIVKNTEAMLATGRKLKSDWWDSVSGGVCIDRVA